MLQTPPAPPALTVHVNPAKAGTADAPAPATVRIDLAGDLSGSALTIFFPQGLRISNTGLAACDATDAQILKGKCRAAKAGSGLLTTKDGERLPIKPLVSNAGLTLRVGDDVLRGAFSGASGKYSAKLTVKLPKPLRKLSALSLTLNAEKGDATLFGLRGCPLSFKTVLGKTLTADADCV